MPKVGWKTTEFWVTAAIIVASITTTISGDLPDKWAAVASSIAGAAYALSRGLAKLQAKPTVTTTPK